MRIASLTESRVAVVKDDSLVDVSGALGGSGASMIDLILRYDALKGAVADVASIADRPAAAASVCTTQPLPIPSAEATPTRRPWAMLEPRM